MIQQRRLTDDSSIGGDIAKGRTPLLRRVKVAIDYADNAEYLMWADEASVSRHPLGLTPARP
jgi:hypothetical protein